MKSIKTNIMNRFISIIIAGISFLIACCCISCKETVYESLEIFIQNKTDSIVHVRLYPTGKPFLTLYPMCEECGGKKETEFSLSPNNERFLFSSSDLYVGPYTLASKAFDSIHISLANKDLIIKFTHENVTGYSENIFIENSTWDFRIEEGDKEMVSTNEIRKFHRYRFWILKDKIIIE